MTTRTCSGRLHSHLRGARLGSDPVAASPSLMAFYIWRPYAATILSILVAATTPGAYSKMLPRRMLDDTCIGWSAAYGQCGGITCPDGKTGCSDTAYSCCPTDFSCQRQNEWYWQCLQGEASPTVQAAPAAVATSTPTATPPGQYAAAAYQSFVTSWPSSKCQVVTNNANYPNGLQCQGAYPDPACCSGADCNVYEYWNATAVNTAWATSSPDAGLASPSGACYQDYFLGCCPSVSG